MHSFFCCCLKLIMNWAAEAAQTSELTIFLGQESAGPCPQGAQATARVWLGGLPSGPCVLFQADSDSWHNLVPAVQGRGPGLLEAPCKNKCDCFLMFGSDASKPSLSLPSMPHTTQAGTSLGTAPFWCWQEIHHLRPCQSLKTLISGPPVITIKTLHIFLLSLIFQAVF